MIKEEKEWNKGQKDLGKVEKERKVKKRSKRKYEMKNTKKIMNENWKKKNQNETKDRK